VGYATKRRGFLLTDLAEDSPEEVHKVEYFLNILKAAGIEAREKDYEFFFGQSDREYVKKFLSKNGVREEDQIFVINPGGNWDPKRWPKGNYAEVADRLIDDYKAKVVITGAAKDVKLAEDIASAMKKSPVIACGATTLKQLAALLERADLVIANDTGPMHIGVAVGSDVIALFGPTSPAITGPCGKGRYKVITRYDECEVPCYDLTCADNRCMKAIRVEDVLREVAAMLSQKSKVKSQNCNSKLKT
jgi:lipopolysaccharide heptosyltransferase II